MTHQVILAGCAYVNANGTCGLTDAQDNPIGALAFFLFMVWLGSKLSGGGKDE